MLPYFLYLFTACAFSIFFFFFQESVYNLHERFLNLNIDGMFIGGIIAALISAVITLYRPRLAALFAFLSSSVLCFTFHALFIDHLYLFLRWGIFSFEGVTPLILLFLIINWYSFSALFSNSSCPTWLFPQYPQAKKTRRILVGVIIFLVLSSLIVSVFGFFLAVGMRNRSD